MFQILIVDDEEQMRTVIARVLINNLPCEISQAESACEAVLILSQKPFHIIVSDLCMSDNGLDILRFLLKRKLNIPMILFSATANLSLPSEPPLIGIIEKPDLKTLVERIQNHLGKCA